MTAQGIATLLSLHPGLGARPPASGETEDSGFATLLDAAADGQAHAIAVAGDRGLSPTGPGDPLAAFLPFVLAHPADDAPSKAVAPVTVAAPDDRRQAPAGTGSAAAESDTLPAGEAVLAEAAGPEPVPHPGRSPEPGQPGRPEPARMPGVDGTVRASHAARPEMDPALPKGTLGIAMPVTARPVAGPKPSATAVAAAARGGGGTVLPLAPGGESRGDQPDAAGDRGRQTQSEPGRARPTVTPPQNFSVSGPEIAPKRVQPDGPPAPSGPHGDATPRTLAAGASGNLPLATAGPVTDVGIRFGMDTRLAVRIGVETEAVATRIAAETGRLAGDLSAIGAELDTLRVEVRVDSRALEASGSRGLGDQGRGDAAAVAAQASGDAAGRDARREGDGSADERLAGPAAEDRAEDRDGGRNGDGEAGRNRQEPAAPQVMGRNGWDDDRARPGQNTGADGGPRPPDGRTPAAAGGVTRIDRLA